MSTKLNKHDQVIDDYERKGDDKKCIMYACVYIIQVDNLK
jgi:hypothetical protein